MSVRRFCGWSVEHVVGSRWRSWERGALTRCRTFLTGTMSSCCGIVLKLQSADDSSDDNDDDSRASRHLHLHDNRTRIVPGRAIGLCLRIRSQQFARKRPRQRCSCTRRALRKGYCRSPTVNHATDNTRKTGSQYALDQPKHTGGDGGQGRDRTGDLPLFRRTLIPTELPGRKAPTRVPRRDGDPDGTRTRDLRRDRAAR